MNPNELLGLLPEEFITAYHARCGGSLPVEFVDIYDMLAEILYFGAHTGEPWEAIRRARGGNSPSLGDASLVPIKTQVDRFLSDTATALRKGSRPPQASVRSGSGAPV